MAMLAALLGGAGLFLLGMSLLTDGLKTLSGSTLRNMLSSLTGGSVKAFSTGLFLTALVQSSAATLFTTIGFTGAGLISFYQAVGVMLGANIGTTSTGWIVAVLGLHFSIQIVALPLLGIGALLKVYGGERFAPAGLALSGFGLIFVGIDFLQTGLSEVSYNFDFASIPTETLFSRVLLVLSGCVATIILQSSSVAVAMTITALHTGGLTFEQAALLVTGQNIGTSFTPLLAVIGASDAARRTAVAHISFNLMTGILVFLMLDLFIAAVQGLCNTTGLSAPVYQLAMFHTAFNTAGVAVALPLIKPFVSIIERLVPERGPALSRYLDHSVAAVPEAAIAAARQTMIDVYVLLVQHMEEASRAEPSKHELALESEKLKAAVEETRRYLHNIRTVPDRSAAFQQHQSILLAIDHLDSLLVRKLEYVPFHHLSADPDLQVVSAESRRHLALLKSLGNHRFDAETSADVQSFSLHLAEIRKHKRLELIQKAAAGLIEPEAAQEFIEQLRWIDSLFFHLWKVREHLSEPSKSGAA